MSRVNALLDFINESPTPYHAVKNLSGRLASAGYKELPERSSWQLKAGERYYVQRNGSSLIAFSVGGKWKPGNGVAVIGAHTDSCTLRVKPQSLKKTNGYLKLGVEAYGGGQWPTWFDRDLSLAGRVYVTENGQHVPKLLKINRPLLRIPTLAVHLNRDQATKLDVNKETHVEPILGLVSAQLSKTRGSEQEKQAASKIDGQSGAPLIEDRHPPELLEVIASELGVEVSAIDDFELVLYDTQPACVGGLSSELVFAPRLDNLCSSFCAVDALLAADSTLEDDVSVRAAALFDHEEIGSASAQGAASNFLEAVISRIASGVDASATGSHTMYEALARSFLLSADMAHAVHPNYAEKHEANHKPQLNAGPVIKVNANQRYATNSPGIVLLQKAAVQAEVPLQFVVVRNDSPCGSTIGPILASRLGIRTLDIGNPQLSMHSIRETAGSLDVDYSIELYKSFYNNFSEIDQSIL